MKAVSKDQQIITPKNFDIYGERKLSTSQWINLLPERHKKFMPPEAYGHDLVMSMSQAICYFERRN